MRVTQGGYENEEGKTKKISRRRRIKLYIMWRAVQGKGRGPTTTTTMRIIYD